MEQIAISRETASKISSIANADISADKVFEVLGCEYDRELPSTWIASALYHDFGLPLHTVARILYGKSGLGLSAAEVSTTLEYVFDPFDRDAMLRDVAVALSDGCNLSAIDVARALKQGLSLDAAKIADVLEFSLGLSYSQVANALKNGLYLSANRVARALKDGLCLDDEELDYALDAIEPANEHRPPLMRM